MRTAFILLFCLLVVGCDQADQHDWANQVTIYRDTYGVPHVHGKTDASAAFGFAYAQAEDNFWQVEDNFIRAIGRASEVHGDETLMDDWLNRGLAIPALSKVEYEEASPRLRALCEAYAAGLNHYVATHPDVEPRLLDTFEPWHTLAFIRYLYYQRGFVRAAGVTREMFEAAFEAHTGEVVAVSEVWDAEQLGGRQEGSNSWAVTPERSASGNALLFINPHLPFFGPSQVYEGHVISDEGWNFTGYTRFGFPLPYVGFNPTLGWASTDNYADLNDAYRETFDDPNNPLAYRYGDSYREATTWTDTIYVYNAETQRPEERVFTYRKTHHGPLLGQDEDGHPLAIRMAKFEEPGWLDQWYAMTRATDLATFRAAVERLDMLFGNYLYADNAGNIFYVYNAAVPMRDTSFAWRGIVDGSDPATEWQGYHPMTDLPQLLNPASGYLQNCNQTPLVTTSTGNPRAEDFPPYMVVEPDNARSQSARRILESQDTFTFEEWATLAYDTYAIEAETSIPELVAAWETLQETSPRRANTLREAVNLLREWDRVSTLESEAMTLYVRWWVTRAQMQRDEVASPEIPALEQALEELEADWGTWRVAWGEMNRLQRIHSSGNANFDDAAPSIAIAGGPSWCGTMFTFWGTAVDEQKRLYGRGGNSYVSVVEFGSPIQARSLHPFGGAADPESPHYYDQQPLYAEGQFKPAWVSLDDVKANAVRAYRPGTRP